MIKEKGKIETKEFADHISSLLSTAHSNLVDGFNETQKELLTKYLDDTFNLIENSEWGVGLENLLTNLYEIDFSIDGKTIELAYNALESCDFKLDQWNFIEELKNK